MTPVFDGHNDVLSRLWRTGDMEGAGFFTGQAEPPGHIDHPRALAGGLVGGFFAVFAPPVRWPAGAPGQGFPMLDEATALAIAREQAAILHRLGTDPGGRLRVTRTVAEIEDAQARGALAAIFHIEGADGLDEGLVELDRFHALGLRSLGLVWSRPNRFAHGVPFRHDASPDTGPGLSEAGRRLVRRCNELDILIDLSHLNEKGFWDVAALSDAPLVATHSNAHALCPQTRNLTDDQLRAIADSRGVVGLNFAVSFLRRDGEQRAATGIDTMIAHLDHLLSILGEDGVALGSDFDGATVPAVIGDAAGLPVLVAGMREAGYGEALIARICRDNWMRVLRDTWGG